jgi:hypothetical protein
MGPNGTPETNPLLRGPFRSPASRPVCPFSLISLSSHSRGRWFDPSRAHQGVPPGQGPHHRPDLGAKLPPNLPQALLRPNALGTPLNRPIWPSGCRSARKSARLAVATTDFFADFLAALVASLADQEVRRSHTLGIRLGRLRRRPGKFDAPRYKLHCLAVTDLGEGP